MSTHNLDVSGARPLTTTLNDPARTAASCSAKAGDDVNVTVSGCRETRFVLPPNAKIERREYVRKTPRKVDGALVKDPDNPNLYLYDEEPYEELVVVVTGASIVVFGRTSNLTHPDTVEEAKAFEGTPHTSVVVRRSPDPHFTESGKLLTDYDIREIVTPDLA